MIELRGVDRAFQTLDGKTTSVVRNLTMALSPGAATCVLSSNGRGKTTLLRLIAGVLEPTSGAILRNGGPNTSVGVGYVHQQYRRALFPWLTVDGNVALATGDRNRINDSLQRTGLAEFHDRSVSTLSGGQAQLVAIARALAMPGPIVADEPTSALDLQRAFAMTHELRLCAQRENRECLIATHEIDLGIIGADRLLVFPSSSSESPVEFEVKLESRTRDVIASASFQQLRLNVLSVMFK